MLQSLATVVGTQSAPVTCVGIPPGNENLVVCATDTGSISIWDTGFVFRNVDGACNSHSATVSKVRQQTPGSMLLSE
jgi:hypothetical protein